MSKNGTNYIELRQQVLTEMRKEWNNHPDHSLTETEAYEAASNLAKKYIQRYWDQLNSSTIRRYVREVTGVQLL